MAAGGGAPAPQQGAGAAMGTEPTTAGELHVLQP
jgi:hypothetical protein